VSDYTSEQAPFGYVGEDGQLHEVPGESDPRTNSSWKRIDLTAVVNGTYEPPRPTMMLRTDGHGLLYPGLVHTFQGEPESGKSMVVQAEAARVLSANGSVLYLDFESDQGTVVTRMMALGATPEDILAGLDYRRPEGDLEAGSNILDWQEITSTRYDLAVIDGVNEALAVFGYAMNENDDIIRWGRALPKALATHTGAAVACVDHVTKSKDGRGRFAIGAQSKLSYLTGTSYNVDVVSPLIKGQRGVLSLRIGKDRAGGVRPHAGQFRDSDRSQEAAVAVFDSRGDHEIIYSLEAPNDKTQQWRPTGYMEKISRAIEDSTEKKLSKTAVRSAVGGSSNRVDEALNHLETEHYVSRANSRAPYVLVRPFRENETGLMNGVAA
jgi:hypothetical protein